MHRQCAIVELMKSSEERWGDLRWPVMLSKGRHPMLTLKQIARSQNARQSEKFYVEPTQYDTLYGLREEHERLSREKNVKKVTYDDVAAAYDGSAHAKESTVKQIAATATRLPRTVIEAIGSIMNEEHPKLAIEVCSGKDDNLTRGTVSRRIDCRVFVDLST